MKSHLLSLVMKPNIKNSSYMMHFAVFATLSVWQYTPITDPHIRIWLKLNPNHITLEEGFSRDVTNIGHWGTGNVELIVHNEHDLNKAKMLLDQAYQENECYVRFLKVKLTRNHWQ
nr:hypothetical protein [Xenorhabdus lircayensis]